MGFDKEDLQICKVFNVWEELDFSRMNCYLFTKDTKDVLKKIKDKQNACQLIVWYQDSKLSTSSFLFTVQTTHVQSVL